VDRYRFELFGSIKSAEQWIWGPFLCGHVDKCQKKAGIADYEYEGRLTEDPNTPFHSCDSRGVCPIRDAANVVQIIPVTTTGVKHVNSQTNSEITSDITGQLKRKRDDDDSKQEVKRIILKEPGHTLLAPRASWWTKENSKERPPILSEQGESLPYFIVRIFTLN
jgi:hypothetical protein